MDQKRKRRMIERDKKNVREIQEEEEEEEENWLMDQKKEKKNDWEP